MVSALRQPEMINQNLLGNKEILSGVVVCWVEKLAGHRGQGQPFQELMIEYASHD